MGFDSEDPAKMFKNYKKIMIFEANKDEVFSTPNLSKRTSIFYRKFAESTLDNDIEREKKQYLFRNFI